jgi:hypothetical protein
MDDNSKDNDVLALPPATPPAIEQPAPPVRIGIIGHMDSRKLALGAALAGLSVSGRRVLIVDSGTPNPVPKLPKIEPMATAYNFPEVTDEGKRLAKRKRKADRPAWRR